MNKIRINSNDQGVIRRLSKRGYYYNKHRHCFTTIAIALTTFMITTVFSLGCSYFETLAIQQIRSMGTTADVAITSLKENQIAEIISSDLVENIGISQRLGSVDSREMGDTLLSLTWIDKTEWEKHRVPSITDLYGNYPQSENEVMLPTWVLNEIGVSDPQIGMIITLSYQLGNDYRYMTDEFLLSGYYTDYSNLRVGNRGSIYVSEAFSNNTESTFSEKTTGMISLVDKCKVEYFCEIIKEKILFTEGQTFAIVPTVNSNSAAILEVLAFVIIMIIFCAYLLVYNILYISIVKDTRSYGQLRTIGATKKQVRRIVQKQMLRTSVIGIPIGLLLGTAFSLIIVPFAMSLMYSDDYAILGVKVSFSPIIFIGATFFTLLTAVIGGMKPAKIAGSISPINASRYIDLANKLVSQRNRHRLKLSRMALNNIFRNSRSSALTFGSLFLGLCLFLVSTGLLSSLTPESYVEQWGESDFAVTCNTQEEGTEITEDMLEKIKAMDGIENIRLTYAAFPQATVDVLYDQDVFGRYVNSLDGVSGLDFANPEVLKRYTENFFSIICGIDKAYVEELNETLEFAIDLESFENGDIILLSTMNDSEGNSLFQSGQSITIFAEKGEHTFTIADGFLDKDFQSARGIFRGTAPNLYISQSALKELFSETQIFRIAFDTADSVDDKKVLEALHLMLESFNNVNILSRYEKNKEIEGYLFSARVLATGLSSVFLLIGIMNYINTMAVSVNTRKHEFAILESIGMTKKQIKTVLLLEGGYYWAISFLLITTLGAGIYIPLYMAFKKVAYYAKFNYPFAQLLAVAAIVLLICLAVPIITFNNEVNMPVINRLRHD